MDSQKQPVTEADKLSPMIEEGQIRKTTDDMMPLVYDELRRLARSKLANESSGQTIQATSLVHDAYLRLIGNEDDICWNSQGHFFCAAAEAMRRILIENARRSGSLKRGGDYQRLELKTEFIVGNDRDSRITELDEAIEKLSTIDDSKATLVKLKLYAGLTTNEAGQVLGMSTATAYRIWEYCRAWLKVELS